MAKAAKPAAKGGKSKKMSKSAFLAHLTDGTEHKKSDVAALYDKIVDTITDQLKKSGEFVLPGVAKFKLKKIPATKGGEKKVMPATGQEYVTKPKPASNKVRASFVKGFKDSLN